MAFSRRPWSPRARAPEDYYLLGTISICPLVVLVVLLGGMYHTVQGRVPGMDGRRRHPRRLPVQYL